jgi:hypothetical protein
VEDRLEMIYQKEGIYWQQRSVEQWVLEGDANTAFFHSCANGRRRKTKIYTLEVERRVLCTQREISKHIVDFYKNLFGSNRNQGVHLELYFWNKEGKLGEEIRTVLEAKFSEKEVQLATEGMKIESVLGPNGFSVNFVKRFWKTIKNEIMKMVQDFNRGTLDLSRLNYGVFTLIPKIKEANTIKQYRTICLLNVDFKVFPKLMTDRITPPAKDLICDSQTSFIKGRNILEGVIILHEVIHELRRTWKQGVIFKINFEKAYDKVKWEFLQEVMERKGYPPNWIKIAMCIVQGGECVLMLMVRELLSDLSGA